MAQGVPVPPWAIFSSPLGNVTSRDSEKYSSCQDFSVSGREKSAFFLLLERSGDVPGIYRPIAGTISNGADRTAPISIAGLADALDRR